MIQHDSKVSSLMLQQCWQETEQCVLGEEAFQTLVIADKYIPCAGLPRNERHRQR